jgi:hypothetical protein
MPMDTLFIPATKTTPQVDFNSATNVFELKGRSIPADAMMFYQPLERWCESYAANSTQTSIAVDVKLDHLNTGSVRTLLSALSKLLKARDRGVKVQINWYYDVEDEDMMDKGEEISLILDHPFKYIAVRSEDY